MRTHSNRRTRRTQRVVWPSAKEPPNAPADENANLGGLAKQRYLVVGQRFSFANGRWQLGILVLPKIPYILVPYPYGSPP